MTAAPLVVRSHADVVSSVPSSPAMPSDLLLDGERKRLQQLVAHPNPTGGMRVVTSVTMLLSAMVWFPVVWTGTGSADTAMQQQVALLVGGVAARAVVRLVDGYARDNAMTQLRRDSVARMEQMQASLDRERREAAQVDAQRRAVEALVAGG